MKAFQFVEWQKPGGIREVPVPDPGPGQVLMKVGGAGACHSDLHIMEAPAGSKPFQLPFTLGHENAGWVEKLRPGATGFAPGDPVIVYGPWGCGSCADVVNLAQAGKIRMLIEYFPLERAGEAYRSLHDGKIQGRAVITPND
jgi:D-arabinose 1-dehydrogenase-like Zn-dependent alcohol dehydrogenase